MFKKIGKNYKRLIFCLALFMVGILLFSRFSQAASGLQVGQSSLILTAAESLIFGNISASSATTSKLLLLQNAGVPKLTVDYYGNLTTPATITAGALSGPMSGTLNAANVSSGLPFGANTGGGNYSFPGNLGIDGTLTGSSLLRQTFGNIKKNAGGEGGAAYWNGSAFSVSSTYARSGANSLRMSGGTSHCNEYIYEDFDTKANTYYSLSGWIKTISETANSAIFISEGVGTGCSEWGRMINSGITGTTDWTQKYIEGWSSGSCTKVRVGFTKQYCDSSGDTYFDDLMVTEGYSPKAFFTRPILDSSSAAQSILGGNLGLGTLTPAARLHVSTAHTGDGALGQRWSYNGGDTMYYLDLKQTVTPGVVRWNFSSVNNGTAYNNTLVLDRGNVGVGTTDPYKTLHVYGAGAALRVGPYYSTDDRDYIDLTAHGSDTRISSRNERFHLENTGGPLVLQGSSGNVGIGVTAPAAKLEVGGNTVIDASSVSWSEGLSIDSSNGVWGGIKWRTIGRSGNTGNWHLGYNATHSLTTDSNLYMYNAAGLYPMTWDYDTGNVGIKTTAPSADLHVSGSLRTTSAMVSGLGSSGSVIVMADNSGNLFSTSTSAIIPNPIPGGTSGQTLRRSTTAWVADSNLYNNGTNVGIGTTGPASSLVVQKNTAGGRGGELSIVNAASGQAGNSAAINFGLEPSTYDADNGNAQIKAILTGSTATDLVFSTWNGSAWGERMRIQSDGNVGIGTTNPLAKVQINNQGAFNATTPGPSSYYGLYFNGQTTTDYATGITWNGGTTGTQAGLYVQGSGAYGTKMYFATTNSYATGAQTRMMIDHMGNVGVNIISPSTKLHVNGSFRANSALISGLGATGNVLVMADNSGNLYTSPAASSLLWSGSTSGNIWNANSGNVGIGTNNPGTYKLYVNGTSYFNDTVFLRNGYNKTLKNYLRADDFESFINIDDTMTTAEVAEAIGRGTNTVGITKVDDPTAPAPGAFEVSGYQTVGPDSVTPYWKVDQDSEYIFETWIKVVSGTATTQRFYAGWEMYDSAKTSFGNNQRYWGSAGTEYDSNSYNDGQWHHIVARISGVGSSNGQFISGTEYARLVLLFNYSSGDTVTRYAGMKLYKSKKLFTSIYAKNGGQATIDSDGKLVMDYNGNIFANNFQASGAGPHYFSAGNVGIGSTNPGTKLDVSTSFRSNSATITGLGATGNVVVMADNTGLLYTSPAASSLLWSGTTSGNIWNANSGNVGVGTSTPASKLTVVSGNPAAPYSGIGLFSGSASSYTSYTVGRTAVDGYFGVAGSSNHYLNGTAAGDVIIDSVSGKVVIGTGAIVGTLGLVVNNGSVGIGTNAPGSKLDVQTAGYGWPATSGSVQTYGGLRISPPSASGSVVLDTGVNTSSGGWLQVTNRGNLSIEYPLILNPNGGNVGVGATSPGTKLYVDTSFRTNTATVAGLGAAGNVTVMADNSGNLSTAKMWLLNGTNVYYSNTGSVGIGTATPGAKLHVYSSAASGFLDNLATAVFDKDDSRLQIRSTDAGTYGSGLILTTASSSWAMMAQTSSDANKFYIGYRLSTASEDIPSASSKFLTIKTDGNVGVGVTSPGARLEVSSSLKTNSATITGLGTSGNVVVMADNSGGLYATSTAAFFNSYVTGDINLGNHNITNVNKLTVNTIDPLYSIGGKKYSTYASSLAGGVKEEYVGRMYIGREIKENGRLVYENTLDFAKIEAGSDLWVWRKVVDFNRDNVEVLITPYGSFASTYYLVGDNKIIFRSSAPVEVSYRLIGKRFDWRLWPTFQPNASERGLLVE